MKLQVIELAVNFASGQELGVDAAMVNWEGDPRRFAPTVLSLTTLSSCVIYVGLYFAAPTVAELLGAPFLAAPPGTGGRVPLTATHRAGAIRVALDETDGPFRPLARDQHRGGRIKIDGQRESSFADRDALRFHRIDKFQLGLPPRELNYRRDRRVDSLKFVLLTKLRILCAPYRNQRRTDSANF